MMKKILDEILRMINKEINNKIIIDSKKQNISIMVWNWNSLKNYTKRTFLIEQLLINNIQISINTGNNAQWISQDVYKGI